MSIINATNKSATNGYTTMCLSRYLLIALASFSFFTAHIKRAEHDVNQIYAYYEHSKTD